MRDIRVDEELYIYIMSLSEHGEGAAEILRRELGQKTGARATLRTPTATADTQAGGRTSLGFLAEVTSSAEFAAVRDTTGRYLFLLAKLHERHGAEFARVLNVRGRSRIYFSDSRKGIESAGTSTHPQKIAGSEYWALTNMDTDQKKDTLINVLRVLGYDEDSGRATAAAL